jgi:two-component system sensor histidine kinase/response regulator
MKILVIEDEEPVRENILEILEYEGFEAVGAEDGRVGLRRAQECRPDLIVCDIAMPEMDGYSVLAEIRQLPETAATPFIFLTARADRPFMRHGMELGADDYLTKPFSSAELIAAVTARLERQNATTQDLEKKLEDTKRQLVQMVSHELRTPLISIEMALDLISRQLSQLSPPQIQELLDYIGRGSNRLHHLVEQMVLITQLETGTLTADIVQERGMVLYTSELLIAATNMARRFAPRSLDVPIRVDERDQETQVRCDPHALEHALAEIMANAINFSPEGTEAVVTQWQADGDAVISVVDQGPGIPPDQLQNALREFHQINRRDQEQQGMGLGLPLARRIIEVHQGDLDIQSRVGRGTQVTVRLPLAHSG